MADFQIVERMLNEGRGDEALRLLGAIAQDADEVLDVRMLARVLGAQVSARMYNLKVMSQFIDGCERAHPSIDLLQIVFHALTGEKDGVPRLVDAVSRRLDGPLSPDEMRFIAEALSLAIARSGHGDELFDVLLRLSGAAHDKGVPGLVTSLFVADAAFRSRADLEGARLIAQRAVDLADHDNDMRNLPFALAQLASAEAGLGRESCLTSATRLAAFDAPAAVLVADFSRGLYNVTVGNDRDAFRIFSDIHHRFGGDQTAALSWHAELVELCMRFDDRNLAMRVDESIRQLAALAPIPWLLAATDRVEGILALEDVASCTSFARAIERYEAHGYLIAAARTRLAWLRHRSSASSDASAIADQARMRFQSAGMNHWADQCSP